MYKGHLPGADAESKPTHFFHDDTLKSFFRRLTFTPDGELLIVPSGLVEEPDKKPMNSTIIFSRTSLNKPVVYLPSLNQYTVAVRCCPVLFTLRPMQSPPLFDLPYRVVIAVATQCSVILYDTQHAAPFAFITKIHYTRLTDLSWSSDGRILVVSSTDGYCSVVTFAENELGTVYTVTKEPAESIPGDEKKPDIANEEVLEMETQKGKIKSSKRSNENNILGQSEDANMCFETNDEKEQYKKCIEEKEVLKKQFIQDSDKVVDSKEISSVGEAKETPMEVDDFQLVYEGTVTESAASVQVKESKPEMNPSKLMTESSNQPSELLVESDSKSKEEEQSDVKLALHKNTSESITVSSGQSPTKCSTTETSFQQEEQSDVKLDLHKNTSESIAEASDQSPVKCSTSTTSLQQQALTSPSSASPSGINKTPGNSNKKTPRRVQLITLSSPKSKKKLLQ